MYSIKITSVQEMFTIHKALQSTKEQSRFTFDIESVEGTKFHRIILRKIRLKKSKSYCGNHAGPCLLGGAHRKGKWLEGADWVAFNDMVNDILDRLNISASVQSSVCVIRLGLERCIEYLGPMDNGDFERYGSYKNCIGQCTKARYPNGTPGIDTWKL